MVTVVQTFVGSDGYIKTGDISLSDIAWAYGIREENIDDIKSIDLTADEDHPKFQEGFLEEIRYEGKVLGWIKFGEYK